MPSTLRTRRARSHRWRASAALLLLCGLTQVGIGLYFLVFRPPMLPEDMRFTGATLTQLLVVAPGLGTWLQKVFSVLGGHVVATGILVIHLSFVLRGGPSAGARLAAWLGGAASVGWMAFVNFAIGSDYRWPLFALAAIWAAGLAADLVEMRKRHEGPGTP